MVVGDYTQEFRKVDTKDIPAPPPFEGVFTRSETQALAHKSKRRPGDVTIAYVEPPIISVEARDAVKEANEAHALIKRAIALQKELLPLEIPEQKPQLLEYSRLHSLVRLYVPATTILSGTAMAIVGGMAALLTGEPIVAGAAGAAGVGLATFGYKQYKTYNSPEKEVADKPRKRKWFRKR